MVKQWVSQPEPLPTRTQIPNDIWKGNRLASQDSLQRPNTLPVSRSRGRHVSSSKEAVINSRSSYSRLLWQRKQLFRNKCFLQDGTSKQEARSLGSRRSFLLRRCLINYGNTVLTQFLCYSANVCGIPTVRRGCGVRYAENSKTTVSGLHLLTPKKLNIELL